MTDIDPLKLDRDVARSARAERAWLRTLRADVDRAAGEAWFEPTRYVTTRTTFSEVSSLPSGDPLRASLLRWMHRLALTRIARGAILDAARARQNATIQIEKPEPGSQSAGAIVRRVLVDTELPRARTWMEGLLRGPSPAWEAERYLQQARYEISGRLGVPDADAFSAYDASALRSEAEHFLRRTDDLASVLLGDAEDLPALMSKMVARDVPGVWPSRPDARWLFDRFQGSELLQGLSLDLGPTPSSLGVASFARALARFGAAYARSAVLGRAPFVISADASDAHPLRRGALFAALASNTLFLRRHIGLSRDDARQAARRLALTFLAALRLDAARATLDVTLVSPGVFAESMERVFCVPVPAPLAGILPRIEGRSRERFGASLLALKDEDELSSSFDEDWFRNPRGLHSLREVDAAPRPASVTGEMLKGQAERLAQKLELLAD